MAPSEDLRAHHSLPDLVVEPIAMLMAPPLVPTIDAIHTHDILLATIPEVFAPLPKAIPNDVDHVEAPPIAVDVGFPPIHVVPDVVALSPKAVPEVLPLVAPLRHSLRARHAPVWFANYNLNQLSSIQTSAMSKLLSLLVMRSLYLLPFAILVGVRLWTTI